MTRLIHQKGLEQFVVGYLTKLPRYGNNAVEQKFLRKSIALIQDFLGYPCCSGGTSVSFVSPYDNELTNTIKAIIQPGLVIRRPFRKSLEEILDLINEKLYGCCCNDFTIITGLAGDMTPADAQVQISDAITGTILFQTTADGASAQTACIPAQYFATSPVNICIVVSNSATSVCGRGGGNYALSFLSDPDGIFILETDSTNICTGYVPTQFLPKGDGFILDIICGEG